MVGRGSRGLVYQIIFTETSEIVTNFSFILLFFANIPFNSWKFFVNRITHLHYSLLHYIHSYWRDTNLSNADQVLSLTIYRGRQLLNQFHLYLIHVIFFQKTFAVLIFIFNLQSSKSAFKYFQKLRSNQN